MSRTEPPWILLNDFCNNITVLIIVKLYRNTNFGGYNFFLEKKGQFAKLNTRN